MKGRPAPCAGRPVAPLWPSPRGPRNCGQFLTISSSDGNALVCGPSVSPDAAPSFLETDVFSIGALGAKHKASSHAAAARANPAAATALRAGARSDSISSSDVETCGQGITRFVETAVFRAMTKTTRPNNRTQRPLWTKARWRKYARRYSRSSLRIRLRSSSFFGSASSCFFNLVRRVSVREIFHCARVASAARITQTMSENTPAIQAVRTATRRINSADWLCSSFDVMIPFVNERPSRSLASSDALNIQNSENNKKPGRPSLRALRWSASGRSTKAVSRPRSIGALPPHSTPARERHL